MNDYAAWRARALRGPSRLSLPRGDAAELTGSVPPPPPAPEPLTSSFPTLSPPSRSLSASAAPPASAGHIDCTDIAARLSEVIQDIAATERGQERAWLNVQPCVLHTLKLLSTAAQSFEVRLRQLESAAQQTQECMTVLVRDREVKEERYRLDVAAHKAETQQLWKRVLLLEAQQQPQQQQQTRCSPSAPQASSSMIDSRVDSLQQELQGVQRQLQALQLLPHPTAKRRTNRVSPARASSSVSASSAAPSTMRGDADGDVRAASSSSPPTGDAARSPSPSPVTQRMLEEVHRLRQQWQHFLRTVPPALARSEEDNEDVADSGRPRPSYPDQRVSTHRRKEYPRAAAMRDEDVGPPFEQREHPNRVEALSDIAEYTHREREGHHERAKHSHLLASDADGGEMALCGTLLPSSGRRVRWYWTGDSRRHRFSSMNVSPSSSSSSAQRIHNGMRNSASTALPWTEWHAFDGRTDCWYSLGTWATHRQQMEELRMDAAVELSEGQQPQGNLRFGWMARTSELVAWPHPSCLQVQCGGIYEVRMCLVHYCTSCQSSAHDAERLDARERVLSLWVDGVAVSGLRENVNHTLLYAPSPAATSPARRQRSPPLPLHPPPRSRSTSAPRAQQPFRSFSPYPRDGSLPQHTHMEEAYRALQRRPCCAPAQMHTHTITACLYLTAGVTLQVRCGELHHSKAICEAFCELTYLV
ncbi:hypothetical protein ABB37_03267 [Leptomonas pyrrhocoris]|uniref:Uncharacterized protein n=1 Tax=Leptomonas pyrrhocoris TaxID=157538 RepID=A0A0N0VFX7_LEPPY|nr:hypothetical protein ABB37_03267 [Leptomonas pyrrhocoris]KPA82121.1 hypothetical protein ABB37_03267 [Leptomonas pyrrhocoris]|eukprot:XP_015660560.1 hypothetical protein ABB37_03267 [Leptomonas pyrrhocoris]